jgi:precorrin-6B methylase 1
LVGLKFYTAACSQKVGKQLLVLLTGFWLLFGLRYTLRPEANRTTIMMIAMTSSTHMMAPRLKKTKPRSHSTISITATTKRKSSAPIFKASLTLNLKAYILRCVTVNKHLQLHHPYVFYLL